jgi:hypothetical protein
MPIFFKRRTCSYNDRKIQKLKRKESSRWGEWQESLQRASAMDREEEIVSQLLLQPLWRIWKPIFEREDASEMALQIHRMLFLQRILQEHLDVFA